MKNLPVAFITQDELEIRDPCEIYKVWSNANESEVWRHTSGDTSIIYTENSGEAFTYSPAPVQRGPIKYNESIGTTQVTLQMEHTNPILLEHLAKLPIDVTWITIIKVFRDQIPYESSILFLGTIKNIGYKGTAISVTCSGFEYYLKRPIPKYRYQPSCNAFLFSDACGVDENDVNMEAVIDSISFDRMTITAPEFASQADDYFVWGKITINLKSYMIVNHVGTTVELRTPLATDVNVDDLIIVCPGCNGSIEICHAKFNNIANFRGTPHIAIENPVLWKK